jgi:nicotinamide-nucleotide amidase
MADGIRQRLGTGIGIGITGIAGPSGGTVEKPVGTVWIAVAGLGETIAHRAIFLGGRAEVRARAVQSALFQLLRRLNSA